MAARILQERGMEGSKDPGAPVGAGEGASASRAHMGAVGSAAMTRAITGQFDGERSVAFKITSLESTADNAPDDWERAALLRAAAGEGDLSEFVRAEEAVRVRTFIPLVATRECLGCHAAPPEGSRGVLGGISIRLPGEPLRAVRGALDMRMGLIHGAAFLLGALLLVGWVVRSARAAQAKRDEDLTHDLLHRLLALSTGGLQMNDMLDQSLALILEAPFVALEPKGAIFLVDETSGQLHLSVQRGLPEALQRTCTLVAFGQCMCGLTAATKALQFSSGIDHRHSTQYDGMAPHGHYSVPIVCGENLVGVLTLYVAAGQRSTPEEAKFLTAVAVSLGSNIERRRLQEQLEVLATTDALTGLWNRARFDEDMSRQISLSRRHGAPLAVIMLDIDHFKEVNDTYGHQAGDRTLQSLGGVLLGCVRKTDLVARWGGEEFIIALPVTDLAGAQVLAERVRLAVAAHRFPHVAPITVSLGVTSLGPREEIGSLIERVDTALYDAKTQGRDRVVAVAPPS